MKKIYLILILLASTFAAQAQPFKGDVIITCNALEERGDSLYLDLDINVHKLAMNVCQSWTIIPELVDGNGNQSVIFPRVLVNGKNKRQMYERGRKFESRTWIARQPWMVVNVDEFTDDVLRYTISVPYEVWMDDATLIVNQILTSCADDQQLFTVDLNRNVKLEPRVPYEASPVLAFLIPNREAVKQRNIQAQAYLDFQVGRSVILPNFRRNPEELAKINATMRQVQSDPDVTITGMFVEGYASPEGSYALNERLSRERSNALMVYMQQNFNIGSHMIRSSSVAEDWDGLRILVEERTDLPRRSEVLSIIDGYDAPDVKERKLKALGNTYRILLNELFPPLRRVEYRIDFTVKDYTVAEARDVVNRNPAMLSNYELYILADTYERNTPEFERIQDIIIRQYPDDPATLNNSGALMIDRGEYTGAKRSLEKAGEYAQTYNNWGVIFLQEGDLDLAEQYFNRAKALGSVEAEHNLLEVAKKREDNIKMERYRNR